MKQTRHAIPFTPWELFAYYLCWEAGRAITLHDQGLWQFLPNSALLSVRLFSWHLVFILICSVFYKSLAGPVCLTQEASIQKEGWTGGLLTVHYVSAQWIDAYHGLLNEVWNLSIDSLYKGWNCWGGFLLRMDFTQRLIPACRSGWSLYLSGCNVDVMMSLTDSTSGLLTEALRESIWRS